jgi:hypothetical protein
MVFEKSSEGSRLQLPTTEPASKHKKPLQKHCKFFLEKSARLYHSIKQPLEQKQLNTHDFFGFCLVMVNLLFC